MPDSRAREPLPSDWGDAFGGLPLETPPEGAWQRVAIALPPAPAPHRTKLPASPNVTPCAPSCAG